MHLYYTSFLAAMALFLSTSAHSILVPEGEQDLLQNGQQPAQIEAAEILDLGNGQQPAQVGAPDILGPGIREAGERLRQMFQQHGVNNLHQAFAAGQNHQPPAQE